MKLIIYIYDYYYFILKFKNDKLSFEYGEAIPWFGKNGGATQIKSNINFTQLKEGVDYEVISKWKYSITDKKWQQIK